MAVKKKKAEDRLKQDLKLEVAVEPMKAGRKIKLTNVNPLRVGGGWYGEGAGRGWREDEYDEE